MIYLELATLLSPEQTDTNGAKRWLDEVLRSSLEYRAFEMHPILCTIS
jgi:hypothetical protein